MEKCDYDYSEDVYRYSVAGAVLVGFITLFIFTYKFIHREFLRVRNPLANLTVKEASSVEECKQLCLDIKSHCIEFGFLGFDCEWVTTGNKRQPIALLQLATYKGLCCLFRLNLFKHVPDDLKDILENENIVKLGVCPLDDANHLFKDYSIKVNSCLDLRHLFPVNGGLACLAKEIIGVELDKTWQIRCSNWEAETLTDAQINYAAKDALVSIEIFKKWILDNSKYKWSITSIEKFHTLLTDELRAEIRRCSDVRFQSKLVDGDQTKQQKPQLDNDGIIDRYVGATRKSPLYHNCFMHAPDGELLCSCDQRKAEWYVSKGLAEVIPGEPFSIRLLFEPAGRAGNSNEGRFYLQLKQNCCVVCGANNSYLRHNVVPREYRKYFPSVMKDHQSHDVVLTCVRCHRLASLHHEAFKSKLAVICDAPLYIPKSTDVKEAKKVVSAAKALLMGGDGIPNERKSSLEKIIKSFHKVDEITPELLKKSLKLETKTINENYEPHGLKVVNYYISRGGGLLELEKMWREHFLETMRPQHLPALWSTTHNHERLEVRAASNRVKQEDLQLAGFHQDVNGDSQQNVCE